MKKDSEILGINTDQLITKIVADWYGKGNGVIDLVALNDKMNTEQAAELGRRVDKLWDELVSLPQQDKIADRESPPSAIRNETQS